jgi:hypothetical protein
MLIVILILNNTTIKQKKIHALPTPLSGVKIWCGDPSINYSTKKGYHDPCGNLVGQKKKKKNDIRETNKYLHKLLKEPHNDFSSTQ